MYSRFAAPRPERPSRDQSRAVTGPALTRRIPENRGALTCVAASAAASSALVGTHPTFTHVPPPLVARFDPSLTPAPHPPVAAMGRLANAPHLSR